MKHDDEELGFELEAWEPPPPPAGIADAVIARVTAPPVVGAVETPIRARRGWWLAVPAAAAAMVAVFVLVGRDGDAEPQVAGSGALATSRPSHVTLGGTAVELEANTDVVWRQEGRKLHAIQPRGQATWRVAANEELVIDTGAMGASVSASGASLRVEVEMNLSDARLIGTSAVTAAAVALVTVIVYEGHVKVTSADRTVEVPAGTTVQVTPNQPPVTPNLVSGREQRLEAQLKLLELENERLRKQLAAPVTAADTTSFDQLMKQLAPVLAKCRRGFAGNQLTLTVDHGPGSLKLGFEPAPPQATAECIDEAIGRADLTSVKHGRYSHVIVFDRAPIRAKPPAKPPTTVVPTPVTCPDAETSKDLERKGDDAMSRGAYYAALESLEKVVGCRRDAIKKAYLAACRARAFPKAKRWFKQIGIDALAQICIKEGFDPREP